MELGKGAVVRLKSGGPKMTVQWETASMGYFCKWFDGPELKEGTFAAEALEIYKAPTE